MVAKDLSLQLIPQFVLPVEGGALTEHLAQGEEIVKKFLPQDFDQYSLEMKEEWFRKNPPLIQWSLGEKNQWVVSLWYFSKPNREIKTEKVFLDFIQKWLIPEKEISILSFYNLYFHLKDLSQDLFFVCEARILIESATDLLTVQDNLPVLANELKFALSSSRNLELAIDTQALTYDQKSIQIHEYLRRLYKKMPLDIDGEIFREMSAFLALATPNFHKFRIPKHLAKIIASQYLLRKKLSHGYSISPKKRHLEFRFIRSKLHFPFGVKSILGLSIGVALTDRYEAFEDVHVISAIQKFSPQAQVVKGSYYVHRANGTPIKSLYLELEKKDGSRFSQKEIQKLQRELHEELKSRIEKLIPSVFMIRNEEEVMRNLLLLSLELKYLSDLPQVMVNFDKQGTNELHFTILVVRILKNQSRPLQEIFSTIKGGFKFVPDRVQNVGYVRKKTPKEANVFHLSIPKDHTISRSDSSVNFYLAREKILSIITEALGEVRDYNGGMILKQGELFSQLKHAFKAIPGNLRELLENFFFTLNPIEAQATTPLSSLVILFELFLKSLKDELPKRESVFLEFREDNNLIFTVLRNKDLLFENFLNEELKNGEDFSKLLIRTKVFFQGTLIQGFIYEGVSHTELKHVKSAMTQLVEKWKKRVLNTQELRLSFTDLPPSLDPRLGGDEISGTLMKMLFEGLTRLSPSGGPALAIARSVDISPDQKKYTFKLRPSYWSNQTKLVAHDFEYAWKKLLSPSFYTPFAYFFYPIKKAKAAKEGKVSLDEVGIKAVDEETLVVDLETPTPEFLEFTANVLYSPVSEELETLHPNWAQGSEEGYVCNGPFKLKKVLSNGGYELIKNAHYWDTKSVKLDRIQIGKSTSDAMYEIFKNDEIDWMGRPMQAWQQLFEKGEDDVIVEGAPGVSWCVFNTQRFPFNNVKIRKAFAYSLNRKKLIEQLPGNYLPAFSPLPIQHSLIDPTEFLEGDLELANRFFQEGLKELNLTPKQFPFLSFLAGKANAYILGLILKQWEQAFGISCVLESHEFNVLFSRVTKGEYQCATIFWKAWINNPMYTLSALESVSNKVNFSKWESLRYQELLDAAKKEVVIEKRMHLLQQAEKILIEECPVISIASNPWISMHKKRLRNAFISETGNIDFKYASISS